MPFTRELRKGHINVVKCKTANNSEKEQKGEEEREKEREREEVTKEGDRGGGEVR